MRAELASLAERQYGVLTRTQITQFGGSERAVDRLRQRGDVVGMVREVFRVAGAPQSWEQQVVAAWLASTGPTHVAVVARATAAALHRFNGFIRSGRPVLVTTRGGSARSDLARIVTCTDLRPEDIEAKAPSGVLVTTPPRTVFDLALGQRGAAGIDRLLDRSLLDGHATIEQLWGLMHHTEASGKRGVVRLRQGLADRSGAYVPLESELEHLAVEALALRGAPAPVRQHPLPGAPFGRVDLAYLVAQLLVELDGRQHRALAARTADYERDVAAARMGWQVLRFDWSQVKFSPAWFAQSVDDVRRAREALLLASTPTFM